MSLDGSAGLATTFDLPFEVLDTEDAVDPDHKLVAKPAKAPTPADVDRALAASVVTRVDDVVEQWLLQTHLGAMAPASMQPGSRVWAAAAARRAVDDRPIALLADWSEERPKVLAAPIVTIPVELPADSDKRCLVFTAIPIARRGDANLVFGIAPAQGSKRFVAIGRDARPDRQAAIELCGVPAGQYALGVWTGNDSDPPGFVVSIFESTSGAGSDDTLKAAMAGAPAAATADEPPSLKIVARP